MKRLATLLLLACAPLHAEDCATIADSAARLACYDTQASQPAPATPAPAPTPAAPATAPVPAGSDFGRSWKDIPPEQLVAHLVYPVPDLQKDSLLTLDNGQAWKCLYAPLGYYPPIPAGTEVTLRKDFFGGYRMKLPVPGDELRVKRLK